MAARTCGSCRGCPPAREKEQGEERRVVCCRVPSELCVCVCACVHVRTSPRVRRAFLEELTNGGKRIGA